MKRLQAGEKRTIDAMNELTAALSWNTADDFDLAAVYESNDSRQGLVYFGDIGSLGAFPYMLLSGDEGSGGAESVQTESLHVSKMSEMKRIWILCWDYDKINEGISAAFKDSGIDLSIGGGAEDGIHVSAVVEGAGNVLLLATISNSFPEGIAVESTPKTGTLKGLHNFAELTDFLELP